MVEPENGGAAHHRDAGRPVNSRGHLPGKFVTLLPGVARDRVHGLPAETQVAAQFGLVIDYRHRNAALGRGQCGRNTGGTSANDGYVHVFVAMAVAFLVLRRDVDSAQATDTSDDVPRQQPEGLGAVQGLVVEAYRHQPMEPVEHRKQVQPQGGPSVLVLDLHSRFDWAGTGTDVGLAVHVHQAVGAIAGAAQQTPGTVVLEAAAEFVSAGGGQGRGYGVALEAPDLMAVKFELDRNSAVEDLSRLGIQADRDGLGHGGQPAPGQKVSRTSLVVVSRLAKNHRRQP